MDRQAKVTSVDALTSFRSSLIIYMGSVGNALDEVRDEVRRMRTWLQVDQRACWGGQLKRLRKQLEQAESERDFWQQSVSGYSMKLEAASKR